MLGGESVTPPRSHPSPGARKARLSTNARGYGLVHKHRRRLEEIQLIQAGSLGVPCVRCGQPVFYGMKWHLDHTDDRTGYLGIAHARCNVRAANRKRRRGGWREWLEAFAARW
jgi:hypothetical protein